MTVSGPLSGVTVVDMTRILAGPYCTLMMAELGARVIKVEPPGNGDDARQYGPFPNGKSTYFVSVNRGKESIALDLKAAGDKKIFEALLERADVLVENFRPGTMEKLGYGWDVLHPRYPRLIYAAASGFGHTGPYSRHPAYDMVVQGIGGIMSVTGEPGGGLTRSACRSAISAPGSTPRSRSTPPCTTAPRPARPARSISACSPAGAARERHHALHHLGQDPWPDGCAPPVDHAVRGLQDEGRPSDHRRRQRRPVREAVRGARPRRSRRQSAVQDQRPAQHEQSRARRRDRERAGEEHHRGLDGPAREGRGSLRPGQQHRPGAGAPAGGGAQHARRGRRCGRRQGQGRRQPAQDLGLPRPRDPGRRARARRRPRQDPEGARLA